MTLRLLPVGMDFYLVRTMERYKLLSVKPSPLGGLQYKVQRQGAKQPSHLHHSCVVKPVVKVPRQPHRFEAGDDFRAQQGHRYLLNGKTVLALESGFMVKVMEFDEAEPWIGKTVVTVSRHLKAQPMKYFHGEVPS